MVASGRSNAGQLVPSPLLACREVAELLEAGCSVRSPAGAWQRYGRGRGMAGVAKEGEQCRRAVGAAHKDDAKI